MFRVLFLLFFAVLSFPSFAQDKPSEKNWGVEALVGVMSGSTSSSPVAGFDMGSSPVFGLKLTRDLSVVPGLSGYVGIQGGSRDVSLRNVHLGDISTLSVLLGGRYTFKTHEGLFSPYVGAGLKYTMIDGTLSNGTIKADGNNLNPVFEAGVNLNLDKTQYKSLGVSTVGVNVTASCGSDYSTKTARTGALIGNVKSCEHAVGVTAGWKF